MKTCWKRGQTNKDRSQRKRAQQANNVCIGDVDVEKYNVGDTREKQIVGYMYVNLWNYIM